MSSTRSAQHRENAAATPSQPAARALSSHVEVRAGGEEVSSASEEPLWRLLRRCTANDGQADWSELVRRVHEPVARSVRKVLRRLGQPTDGPRVEDLVQEVYCRLVSGWERPARRFRGGCEAEATTWLHRVAVRAVLDSWRRARAAKRGDGTVLLHLLPGHEELLPAPERDSPEFPLLQSERRSLVRERCREALGRRSSARSLRIAELALLDGLSSREIVERSGSRLRLTGVNSVIHRLRRGLARRGRAIPRRARQVK